MKPYGRTIDEYGDTGCCPGHDEPRIRKWSGEYSSAASQRADAKAKRAQNRRRRRTDKMKLEREDE